MAKYKGLVRLLNGSVYESERIKNAKYPVIVEAELCTILTGYAEVSGRAVNNFTEDRLGRGYSITWFNPWLEGCDREVSWEHYVPNPFDAWNKLKAPREVGALPAYDTIYR